MSAARLQEETRLGELETFRLLGRAFRYAAPFRARFLAKGALLLASLLPALVLPWPVKIIVDHAIEGRPVGSQPVPYPEFLAPMLEWIDGSSPLEIVLAMLAVQALLIVLVGAVGTGGSERDRADGYLAGGHDQASRSENEANAGFSLSSGLLGLFDVRFTIRLTQAVNHYYRAHLFERIQRLPMSAFDDERIGDAVYRVMIDTPAITTATYRILLTPLASGIFALGIVWTISMLFGDQPILWQSALAMLAIALLVSLPFGRALRRRSGASRRAGATTTSTLEEGLSNIVAVQSLGAEGREQSRFDEDSWASFSQHRSVMRLGMIIFLAAVIPGVWLVSRVFLHTADLVIAGQLSRGDWMLLFSYYLMLLFACIELGAIWIRVQEAAVGLQRVFFLMDLPSEADEPGATPLPRLREGIRLEGVGVVHPDGTRALEGIELEIPTGCVTALVGPAGAGKTTLASLLPRFLDPSEGCVRFDGCDTRTATRASIREQIAFVFQETVLFDDTVEANLRLGRPSASEAELRRAARLAGADRFIRELPQGYRTRLGRAGGKLSVGQRQRLAIARALVCDTPVLILDEPTSALDPETEAHLVRSLHEASRDRAVIVIAHRLSTIRSADQICFLDAGRLVERGTHDELMAREGGSYRRFVELQRRGAA